MERGTLLQFIEQQPNVVPPLMNREKIHDANSLRSVIKCSRDIKVVTVKVLVRMAVEMS